MQTIDIEPLTGAGTRGRMLARTATALALLLGLVLPHAARADFELTGPDGKRYLLKDNGTWQRVDAKDADTTAAKVEGEALLRLERRIERGNHCRLALTMVNNLPYEIGHIVPYLSVYRANGVVHETVSIAFQSIRPSDKVERSADFSRITCGEIARVQVSGGDRCEMGDLNKFSDVKGQCLARVKLAPSEIVRFDK